MPALGDETIETSSVAGTVIMPDDVDDFDPMFDTVPIASPSVGASVPTSEELRMSAAAASSQRGSSSRREEYLTNNNNIDGNNNAMWIAMGLTLLGLLALVIGISVGISKSNNSGSTSGSSSSSINNIPAPRQASIEQIMHYLASARVLSVDDMNNPITPQNQAIQWLADLDERNLPVPTEPASTLEGYTFLSRYVMAFFWYALDGINWNYQAEWLTEKDICDWNVLLPSQTMTGEITYVPAGVFCDDATNTIPMALFLFENNLSGPIPTEIGYLHSLTLINLKDNALRDELPPELCQLDNLLGVALLRNNLFGSLPTCLSEMTNLQALSLSSNLFDKELPDLSKLSNMALLMLDGNADLEGNVTTMFNNMTQLQYLYIDYTSLTATLDENFLKNSLNVSEIDISSCDFFGTLPAHLLELPSLQLLDIHDNHLTGPLPADLKNVSSTFAVLSMQQNRFSGPIPDTFLSHLPHLEHLDLSNNAFSGPLPAGALGQLTALQRLYLSENPLLERGELPSDFAALTGLLELSMKHTNRSGTIPTYLGNLTLLQLLDLDNNDFNGTIPTELGDLVNSQFLLLNRNEGITGQVPSTFSHLTNLRLLYLDGTSLSGSSINDVVCPLGLFNETPGDADGTEILSADCGGDDASTREVECSCCAKCCSDGGQTVCHDSNRVSSLDLNWQYAFQRVGFNFGSGNSTYFPDRQFMDLLP